METKEDDLNDSECDKEESNNTDNNWDARFYNDNIEYDVVDNKEP